MKTQTVKIGISALLAALGSVYKTLAVPFFVLCILMVTDYVTGMIKSWQKGTLCSKTGLRGVVKKLSYSLTVVAAVGVDYVVLSISESLGWDYGATPFFALLCTIWLVINECISILENLVEVGVPMPVFLLKIAKRLKTSVEDISDEHK